jgi:hypothetical protein
MEVDTIKEEIKISKANEKEREKKIASDKNSCVKKFKAISYMFRGDDFF